MGASESSNIKKRLRSIADEEKKRQIKSYKEYVEETITKNYKLLELRAEEGKHEHVFYFCDDYPRSINLSLDDKLKIIKNVRNRMKSLMPVPMKINTTNYINTNSWKLGQEIECSFKW